MDERPAITLTRRGFRFGLPRLALRFPHLTIVLSLVMVGLGV